MLSPLTPNLEQQNRQSSSEHGPKTPKNRRRGSHPRSCCKRALLPRGDLGVDRVGDRTNQIGRDLDGIHLGQEGLNLADRQAPRVQGEDLVVKAREPALVLGDQPRLERARPRGTSIGNGPSSVSTVLLPVPLR